MNSSLIVSWLFMDLFMVEVASWVTSPAIAKREDVGAGIPRLVRVPAVARSGDPAPW